MVCDGNPGLTALHLGEMLSQIALLDYANL
jgi:hypothetical protein